MNASISEALALFRPEDENLSSETKAQIRLHRLLSLLGAVLVPLFGPLRALSNPGAVDPMWARLGIASLLAGLLGASYVSERIRRNYVVWMRSLLYVLLGWFVIVAALNRFAGSYASGVLLVFMILTLVVGLGARSMGPVLRFSGFGLLLMAGAVVLGPGPRNESLVLLGSMAAAALLEGLVIQAHLSTREKLRKREERLRAITENVSDGIYRSTSNGGIVYANQALAEMFGYESPEELLRVDPATLYADPSERERIQERSNEQDGLDGVEIEFRRKDGSTFIGLLSGTVVRGEDGSVKYYDGAVADITERKEQEAALREREARLRGLANSIPGVVYQFYARPGEERGLHFVSEHAESVLGISAEEEGFYERFIERVPASHREAFVESIDEVIDEGTYWRQEIPFEKPSGERVWLFCASTPERREGPEGGEELVFNGVVLDITERKEAERALQEERDRFETLFESLPTPVVRCTVEEGILIADANKSFEDVFGVEASVVEGEDIDELLVPEDKREEAAEIAQSALEERAQHAEVQRKAANGLRDFRLQVAGRKREEGPPEVYVIYTDISEQKEREERLKRQNEQLDRFASVVSHDLRNPLNVAKGRLGLARKDGDPGHLTDIDRALDRMDEIIQNVLALTRGGQEIDPEDLEPCRLAQMAKACWEQVDTARATLRVEGDLVARAHEGRLQRLLENLFRNAVEHGGEEVTVRIGTLSNGFFVEDDGSGIPPGEREEVFEAGYSSDDQGTGLGLSIVETIATAHGWSLSVTDDQEGGARFEFTGIGREE